MKHRLTTITVLITATLLISCGKDSEKSSAQSAKADSLQLRAEDPQLGYSIEGLHLNDGLKWEADNHTRSTISQMVVSFSNSYKADSGTEALKNAGAELQALINELVKGCTMDGAAHDQLHAFLTAYMPVVASLSEFGRVEDAKKIQGYLEIYGEYFE